MGKRGGQETAVIVPLRPDIRNAVAFIVRQAKYMAVAAGRLWVNAVRAVQFTAAPQTAGAQEILSIQLRLVLEDEKAAKRHFPFQHVDDPGRWRVPGGQIHPRDLHADRIESGDCTAGLFDDFSAGRVNRWELR